jgi:RNA polymerase sigma-70 factor (ECF subfamily)
MVSGGTGLDGSIVPSATDPGATKDAAGGEVQSGDANAGSLLCIETLIRQHSAELYRYAYRLTGSQHDAEDLCQQTFLVAHRKLDQVREAQAVRGWLFTVVRHAFLRSTSKQTPVSMADCQLDVDAVAEAATDDWEIDSELLQAALGGLSDEYRVILVLFYFEECSYREIAVKLELPIGTVMSRLSRAKSQLRSRLLEMQVPRQVTLASAAKPATDARMQVAQK